ncbi:DNA-directed DNA polymerase gamma mip1 [Rhizophlyctis rosea]|nr:DNA-directed DNA polymerase gamma mip1 [Rhizophlyctis rosea]
MLPEQLHQAVFPRYSKSQIRVPTDFQMQLAREHLKAFDLYGKTQSPLPDVDIEIPPLAGRNIKEHFRILGREQAEPILSMASSFAAGTIPPMPDEWKLAEGWHRYDSDGQCVPVKHPGEDALVFDTEVMYNVSPHPLIAVAASSKHWYAWISPGLLNQEGKWQPRALVSLGDTGKPRVVVGHHVAYDRARIADEYEFQSSQLAFIDTMSLHSAVGGLSSQQRGAWRAIVKQREEDEQRLLEKIAAGDSDAELEREWRPKDWCDVSSMNSLYWVAKLYLRRTLDKSTRNVFDGKDLTIFKDPTTLQEALDYCAEDVRTTYELFQAVLPFFLEKCPHPASFAGMLHMGKGYLPVTSDWPRFYDRAEAEYQRISEGIETFLRQRADDVLFEVDRERALQDPWLSKMDWTSKGTDEEYNEAVEAWKRDPNGLPHKHLPVWYRKFWNSKEKRLRITSSMRNAPYLLKLQWNGHPVYHTSFYGWMYYIPLTSIPADYRPERLAFSRAPTDPNYDPIASNDTTHAYFRIPHPNGDGKNCGNILSRSFMAAFEDGILTSAYPEATEVLSKSAQSTYWRGNKERISNQFVVSDTEVVKGPKAADGGDLGIILPQSVVMGTITRRASEPTWMTASNAKKTRIGSELKTQIQAPAGYKFVGADVDSEELWIASLLGDAQFRMQGGSAVGFMTLQGEKKRGTDLHSVTASVVGVERDQAKVFNYSRIYGAGLKHAVQLLVQFNPGLDWDVANRKAAELYKRTKGSSVQGLKPQEAREMGVKMVKGGPRVFEKIWFGGSESLMFNKLEEVALSEDPRTPVLHCGIPNSLLPKYCDKQYMTSRINWVVQSSGVDYLHLLLVSVNYLFRRLRIDGRFVLSIHDEVRFVVREDQKYLGALALQVANLWVRAMFVGSVGIEGLPYNVAFFSSIDIDHCLRKEPNQDCITPSNHNAIPPGEAVDIYQLASKLSESKSTGERGSLFGPELQTVQCIAATVKEGKSDDGTLVAMEEKGAERWGRIDVEYLRAQMARTEGEVRRIREEVAMAMGRGVGGGGGFGQGSRVVDGRLGGRGSDGGQGMSLKGRANGGKIPNRGPSTSTGGSGQQADGMNAPLLSNDSRIGDSASRIPSTRTFTQPMSTKKAMMGMPPAPPGMYFPSHSMLERKSYTYLRSAQSPN